MFDLFRSRQKSVRILLGVILLAVSASMLLYLVPSFNAWSGPSNSVVATVADETIALPDVDRVVKANQRGHQLPADLIPNYIPQIVEQMVNDRAMAYEAQRLGFRVTDQDVAQAVEQMIPSLFPDGKFVGKEAYAAMLGQQDLTIPEFENDLRRQVLITHLREVATAGVVVTPLEIQQEYEKRNEKIKVQYVLLKPDRYRAEVQPTPKDMQDYYQANKSGFQTTEKRNLAILIADPAQIAAGLNPTDAQLQEIYNQNKEPYRVPERVKVRHILLMTQGKPATDDPKIKAQAESLLKQIKGGADFAALAKKYSEDPGSKDKGGEYWVQRNGQMVKEFEDAAFTLKPGESEIVKTSYGYHVFQVMQHEQAHLQTFDEVKAQIAAQLKSARAADIVQSASDQAPGMLQKDPLHPEKVAAALHLVLLRADGIEAGKEIPGIGTNTDFDQSIAGLKKGEVSQPVTLPGNKVAIAVATDVIPPRPSTFEEVQSKIHDTLVQNRLNAAVQKHAQELLDKAKSMGGDLEKAAKSMGLEAKTSEAVTRGGTVEGFGSAVYLQEGFARSAGTVFGPVATSDGTGVVKVAEHIAPDPAGLAAQRTQIRDDLKTQKSRDRNTLFETGLRDELIREGKIKIHQDAIERLVRQYTGS